METKDEKLSRFVKAIRWAQLPDNRESLEPELKELRELIERKMDELRPRQKLQVVVSFSAKNQPLTFTPTPLPYTTRTV